MINFQNNIAQLTSIAYVGHLDASIQHLLNSLSESKEPYILLEKEPPKHADIILCVLDREEQKPWDTIASLSQSCPNSKVLVLGEVSGRQALIDCLRAGASGYIDACPDKKTLLKAFAQIQKGGAPLSIEASRVLVSSFRPSQKNPLSIRETEVLQLLSKGKTYSIIAKELFVSGETVRSHIRSIYKKLRVSSKSDAIATAHRSRLLVNIPHFGG